MSRQMGARNAMDRETFLGGSVFGVVVRLLVLSLVVGIVLSALGITPDNFFWQVRELLQRIYDLGFGAIRQGLEYIILGAMVVVPIWLIARLVKTVKRQKETP
jgi:hypothetical protein